jgi:hypothetical protein
MSTFGETGAGAGGYNGFGHNGGFGGGYVCLTSAAAHINSM